MFGFVRLCLVVAVATQAWPGVQGQTTELTTADAVTGAQSNLTEPVTQFEDQTTESYTTKQSTTEQSLKTTVQSEPDLATPTSSADEDATNSSDESKLATNFEESTTESYTTAQSTTDFETPTLITEDSVPVVTSKVNPHFIKPEVLSRSPAPDPTVPPVKGVTKQGKQHGSPSPPPQPTACVGSVCVAVENVTDPSLNKSGRTTRLHITYYLYYVTPLVLLFGVLLHIVLILKYEGRKVKRQYITHVWYCVVDLLLICAILFTVLSDVNAFNCKLAHFVSLTFIGSLCGATTLMTLYKYIFLQWPLSSWDKTKFWHQVSWCIGSFTFNLVTASPMLWYAPVYEGLKWNRNFCRFTGGNYKIYIISWLAVCIGVPLFATLFMMAVISKIVFKHRRATLKREMEYTTLSTRVDKNTTDTTSFIKPSQLVNEDASSSEDDQPQRGWRLLSNRLSKRFDKNVLPVSQNNPTVEPKPQKVKEKKPEKKKFPISILVNIIITILTSLPIIPSLVDISWYYKHNRIWLDILYGTMLISIASAPYIHIFFVLSLRRRVVGLICRMSGCCDPSRTKM